MELLGIVVRKLAQAAASVAGERRRERARRRRRDERHLAEAAAHIRAEVAALRELVVRCYDRPVEAADAVAAWRSCAGTIDRYGHRLPTDWSHLQRSVRFAVNDVWGGVCVADSDYSDAVEHIGPIDRQGWDIALEYLDYVSERLAVIADQPERAQSIELLYHPMWLVAAGLDERPDWLPKRKHPRLQHLV